MNIWKHKGKNKKSLNGEEGDVFNLGEVEGYVHVYGHRPLQWSGQKSELGIHGKQGQHDYSQDIWNGRGSFGTEWPKCDVERFGRQVLLHKWCFRLCRYFNLILRSYTYIHKLIDGFKAEEIAQSHEHSSEFALTAMQNERGKRRVRPKTKRLSRRFLLYSNKRQTDKVLA